MPNIFETLDAAASTSTTYTLQIGQIAQANISSLGDHDWFKVNLVAGHTYTIALVGTGTGGLQDPYLRIYGPDGTTLIAQDDDSLPNNNSIITFTAQATGTFYLDAAAYNNAGTGQYGISIAEGTRATTDVQMGAGIIDAYGSGSEYSWSPTPGTGATVTVGFRMTDDGEQLGFSQFTPQQMAAVQTILTYYSSICGINFTLVNPGGYTDNATILLSNYNHSDGSGAYAYYPGSTAANAQAGDVHVNLAGGSSTSSLPWGSYSFYTLLHELGHSMGLSHPGLYNAGPGFSITYNANAQMIQDTQQYSVMSYFAASNSGANWGGLYAQTLMMYDIYALQQIYGVNSATRSGDSIYGFHSNVGGVYDFSTNSTPALCIWDGGGTDTLDCSGYSGSQLINLNDGTFSNVLGFTSNVSIALNAIIENAIGGSGSDTLIANNSGCSLSGGGGSDTLIGGTGIDRLIGGTGRDTMTGSGSADTFVFATGDSSAATGQHDLITDFASGDIIDISAMGTFRFLGTSAFDGGTYALNYFYNSSTGITTLQGDINGDGVADFAIDLTGSITFATSNFLGVQPGGTVIESFGATSLMSISNIYYLNSNSTGSGPSLKFGGTPVVVGSNANWIAIGGEQTGSGYEIAWKNINNSNQYMIWLADSNGNYVSNVQGNGIWLASYESSFLQDLNGDGVIGSNVTMTVIEANGATSLVTAGGFYYLNSNGTGSGPSLKFANTSLAVGSNTNWTVIAAEQTANGYEIAWRNVNNPNQYMIWLTDSNGNYLSNVQGNSAWVASHEASFNQDLNGDGVIATSAIESNGTTSLTVINGIYFLNSVSTGSGPSLKFGSTPVTVGSNVNWIAIAAEQTGGGYEVAWKNLNSGQYMIWFTDTNGAYLSNQQGYATWIASYEASFNQDLNGDGAISSPALPQASAAQHFNGSLRVDGQFNVQADSISSDLSSLQNAGNSPMTLGAAGAVPKANLDLDVSDATSAAGLFNGHTGAANSWRDVTPTSTPTDFHPVGLPGGNQFIFGNAVAAGGAPVSNAPALDQSEPIQTVNSLSDMMVHQPLATVGLDVALLQDAAPLVDQDRMKVTSLHLGFDFH